MKILTTLILLVISLGNGYLAFGQKQYNLPSESYYQKATIGFKNFQKRNVENLTILSDTIAYTLRREVFRVPFSEVNYIKVQEGTKAGTGAIVGGSTMLLSSLLAIADVETDPNYELKDNAGALTVLFTLGGAAVGGLVGATIPNRRVYYIHLQPSDTN